MTRLCVFCGSSDGIDPQFVETTRHFGRLIIKYDIGLVYGGCNSGLMGELANVVLDGGGEVIGVIPKSGISSGIIHGGLTELKIVNSMHERKAVMAGLADGFVALPGGIGTLEEFAEILSWSVLNIHTKPYALLNVDGYYDYFLEFLRVMFSKGFLTKKLFETLIVEKKADELLKKIYYQCKT